MKKSISFVLVIVFIISITIQAFADSSLLRSDSYFEEHHIDKMTYDLASADSEGYRYETGCSTTNKSTIGTVIGEWGGVILSTGKKLNTYSPSGTRINSFFEASSKQDSMFREIPGYEWRVARFKLIFDDNHANNYGYNYLWETMDYSSGNVLFNEFNGEQKHDLITVDFSMNYNGEKYDRCRSMYRVKNQYTSNESYVELYEFYRVPVGYEDATVCFFNSNGLPQTGDVKQTYSGKSTSTYVDRRTLEQKFGNDGLGFRLK